MPPTVEQAARMLQRHLFNAAVGIRTNADGTPELVVYLQELPSAEQIARQVRQWHGYPVKYHLSGCVYLKGMPCPETAEERAELVRLHPEADPDCQEMFKCSRVYP